MDYIIAKGLFDKLNIDLTENQFHSFNIFLNELLDWNNKINLTSITDDYDIWIKHFIDSCTINDYISQNCSVIDVGTGAGFPGVPMIIIRNDIKLTLLDSLNKRINFLKETTEKLSLKDIKFIHGRAEDIANKMEFREKFDIATARAVANLSVLSEYCLPFVKVGGAFICMKAGNVTDEINEAKSAIKTLGGQIDKIDTFCLPNSDIERTIIVIKKLNPTPKQYPRKAGTPSKQPLL